MQSRPWHRIGVNGNDVSSPVRVIALGDCNTVTSNPLQGTLPDGLVAAFEAHGVSTSVCNLGGGMRTSREGLAVLREYAIPADIAILNFGLVDAWVTTIPMVYVPCYPETFLRKRARKLVKFIKRRLRSPVIRKFVPRGPVVSETEFSHNVHAMIELLVRQNGCCRIFVWGTVPVTNDSKRNTGIDRYNTILRSVALESGALYVDPNEILLGVSPAERLIDGVHQSPETSRLLGQRIVGLYMLDQQRDCCREDAA